VAPGRGRTSTGIVASTSSARISRLAGERAKNSRSSGYHSPIQAMTEKTPLPRRSWKISGTSGSRKPVERNRPTTKSSRPLRSDHTP
jgi:hypothetical protein